MQHHVCQAIWLRIRVLDQPPHETVASHCNSFSAIKLSRNLVMHGPSKHIGVNFHFLKELSQHGETKMVYCSTLEQLMDVLTIPLKVNDFLKLCGLLGVGVKHGIN